MLIKSSTSNKQGWQTNTAALKECLTAWAVPVGFWQKRRGGGDARDFFADYHASTLESGTGSFLWISQMWKPTYIFPVYFSDNFDWLLYIPSITCRAGFQTSYQQTMSTNESPHTARPRSEPLRQCDWLSSWLAHQKLYQHYIASWLIWNAPARAVSCAEWPSFCASDFGGTKIQLHMFWLASGASASDRRHQTWDWCSGAMYTDYIIRMAQQNPVWRSCCGSERTVSCQDNLQCWSVGTWTNDNWSNRNSIYFYNIKTTMFFTISKNHSTIWCHTATKMQNTCTNSWKCLKCYKGIFECSFLFVWCNLNQNEQIINQRKV